MAARIAICACNCFLSMASSYWGAALLNTSLFEEISHNRLFIPSDNKTVLAPRIGFNKDLAKNRSWLGRAWLAQLVRFLPSNHKVPSSNPGSAKV